MSTANKNNENVDPGVIISLIIGLMVIPSLFIAAPIVYFMAKKVLDRNAKAFGMDQCDYRVREGSEFFGLILRHYMTATVSGAVFISVTVWGLFFILGLAGSGKSSDIPYFVTIIYGLLVATSGVFACGSIFSCGLKSVGVLIDKDLEAMFIPTDGSKNTVEDDVIHLKFLKDSSQMEVLLLEDVSKITKERGNALYLHGRFGSRKLIFYDKRIRDECIASLEYCAGRRFRVIDFGY